MACFYWELGTRTKFIASADFELNNDLKGKLKHGFFFIFFSKILFSSFRNKICQQLIFKMFDQ